MSVHRETTIEVFIREKMKSGNLLSSRMNSEETAVLGKREGEGGKREGRTRNIQKGKRGQRSGKKTHQRKKTQSSPRGNLGGKNDYAQATRWGTRNPQGERDKGKGSKSGGGK